MSADLRTNPGKFAILVGGGPAPGINSVIAAAVLRVRHAGGEVLGVRNGFSELMQGRAEGMVALSAADVQGIALRGGAVLGTSRANPTRRVEDLQRVVQTLADRGVTRLITIGGDDTAFSAMKVAACAAARQTPLHVAHVPKTIDDDLDLPPHIHTFGFQTACDLGVELVGNLMADARTTGRWYLVVAMGRKAGSLALGIGKAAGATLTLIPEEFPAGKGSLDRIADTLVGAIVKCRAQGERHGMAVLAEGVAESIPESELHRLGPVDHDEHGHIRLAEIDFGRGVRKVVEERLHALGLDVGLVSKDIGYELRCADPVPVDVEYTRDLGYCAAQFLLDGGSGAMVSIQEGRFVPVPFSTMIDPATGRTRVRSVDMASLRYTVAREYMTRLERQDFADPVRLATLAGHCTMDPGAFQDRFSYVVEGD